MPFIYLLVGRRWEYWFVIYLIEDHIETDVSLVSSSRETIAARGDKKMNKKFYCHHCGQWSIAKEERPSKSMFSDVCVHGVLRAAICINGVCLPHSTLIFPAIVTHWCCRRLAMCWYGQIWDRYPPNCTAHRPVHPAKLQRGLTPATSQTLALQTHQGRSNLYYTKMWRGVPDRLISKPSTQSGGERTPALQGVITLCCVPGAIYGAIMPPNKTLLLHYCSDCCPRRWYGSLP